MKIDLKNLKQILDQYSGVNRKVKGARTAMAGLRVERRTVYGRAENKVILSWLSGTSRTKTFVMKPSEPISWTFSIKDNADSFFFELETFVRRYEVDNNIPMIYDGMEIKLK